MARPWRRSFVLASTFALFPRYRRPILHPIPSCFPSWGISAGARASRRLQTFCHEVRALLRASSSSAAAQEQFAPWRPTDPSKGGIEPHIRRSEPKQRACDPTEVTSASLQPTSRAHHELPPGVVPKLPIVVRGLRTGLVSESRHRAVCALIVAASESSTVAARAARNPPNFLHTLQFGSKAIPKMCRTRDR